MYRMLFEDIIPDTIESTGLLQVADGDGWIIE